MDQMAQTEAEVSSESYQFKISVAQTHTEAETSSEAHLFNMTQVQYPMDLAPRGNEYSEFVAANGTKVKLPDPYRYME